MSEWTPCEGSGKQAVPDTTSHRGAMAVCRACGVRVCIYADGRVRRHKAPPAAATPT